MDKRVLEQILLDQQEELEQRRTERLCYRCELERIDFRSPQAQVVIGVRRSGKSTLCFQAMEKAQVKYGYVNWDDERFMGFGTEQLNDVLEVLYKVNGDVDYFFFDEIQNIQGWPLFVNRLLRIGKHVLLTGSNAKLLSSDLATHLTGRTNVVCLFPFSFSNFCEVGSIKTGPKSTKITGILRAAFDQYMAQGGFPELMQVANKGEYIRSLVRDILHRDIEQRFAVSYRATFENLTNHLLNVAPVIVSTTKLAQTFEFKTAQTVRNYVLFLQRAFLLSGLRKYSKKSKLRMTYRRENAGRNDNRIPKDSKQCVSSHCCCVKNTSFPYEGRCLKRFHLEDETKTRGSMSSKTMQTLIKINQGEIIKLVEVAYNPRDLGIPRI